MKQKRNRRWIWWVLGSLVVILIAARLSLSYFVTRYVNRVLADIPGYYGSIYDIDIRLYRGAYVIDSLKLFKVEGNKRIPFVDIPVSDLSIEWHALFEGEVVGEAVFRDPVLNFIGGHKKDTAQNQTGEDVDWTEPLKKLVPFQINRLEIRNGTVAFYDFTTKPSVDLSLREMHLLATNLNNAEHQDGELPSRITVTAKSIGNGNLDIDMKINVLKEIPDVDMDLKFENVDMTALNDFFKAYAKVDVEKGVFNLYTELAVNDGKVTGYVKPIAQGIKLVDVKEDKNPLNLLWEGMVGALKDVFKNQKKNQLATRMPLEGNLENLDVAFWPAVWNIFRNAFVSAFKLNTDNTVEFTDAGPTTGEANLSKKEQRKKERAEKREARRRNRKSKT
jgi:hypothetical protein